MKKTLIATQVGGFRDIQLEALYRAGKSLRAVGREVGLSAEGARLALRRLGVAPGEGGACLRRETRRNLRAARQVAREADRWDIYGCSRDEAIALNGGSPLSVFGTPAAAFTAQRDSARHRGIVWALSLPAWWQIWQASGHWTERGASGDRFTLARVDPKAGFTQDNVAVMRLREVRRSRPA